MFKSICFGILLVFISGGIVGSQDFESIQKVINVSDDMPATEEMFRKFIKYYQKHRKVSSKVRTRIVDQIFEHADSQGFDPIELLAMQGVESAYKYWVEGKVGEKGIAQINPIVWLSSRNKDNLYNAGIITKGKEYQLIWIGNNIKSHAYILNLKRNICLKWDARKKLKRKGYKSITECYIRIYNGTNRMMSKEYYEKVTSMIGRYYFFVKRQTTRR